MSVEVMIGPTRERLSRVGGGSIDVPVVDQKVVRKAWRIVPVVESMRRAGKISDERATVFEMFERLWNAAGLERRVIGRYGEDAGGGGTLVKQLTHDSMMAVEDADERRRDAIAHVMSALEAMHVPRMRMALIMLVSENCGLHDIGRAVAKYGNRSQAAAVGATVVEDVLWALHQHYILYRQPKEP